MEEEVRNFDNRSDKMLTDRKWDDFFEAEGIKNFPERQQPDMQKPESF